MIRISRLTKHYSGRPVVNQISFDINPGDYVGIIGPSGSGKTTLLSMIAGLTVPSSGDIYFENHHMSAMTRSQWARFRSLHIGLVFQFSELLPGLTVRENIQLPALFARKLDKTGYDERTDFLMEQLDLMPLAEARPMDLSGGQTQLVAIARALINEPVILLADEPSGDLDPGHSKMVKKLLAQYNKRGLSILLVTHDMKLAFDAKTVYEMVDGRFADLKSKRRR